jgi:polysaccharide deacetylase 2 family uncharacterized protein YibQ
MKSSPPVPEKRIGRRLLGLLVGAAVLAGAGWWGYRAFVPQSSLPAAVSEAPALDESEEQGWRKANPWLFARPEIEPFRESLILPLARGNHLGPHGVKRRGAIVEFTFPAGRPLHEYAFELETLCERTGVKVAEGHETGTDQVEYALKDVHGHALNVRLVLGTAALPGAVRMSLVITGLGGATASDLEAWEKFPEAVTLVFPDTAPALKTGAQLDAEHEIFVELPMEPSTYPYVKPGPRALFIDYKRGQAEGILKERLDAYPEARGFATVLGDRAIENPQLMESVLNFMAARSLVFLDLTGSPLSQTAALSQKSGAETFSSREQGASTEASLEAEIERRTGLAKKSGEGIWVLRHTSGLPAQLAKLFARRAAAFGELGLQWVPLGELRKDRDED